MATEAIQLYPSALQNTIATEPRAQKLQFKKQKLCIRSSIHDSEKGRKLHPKLCQV
jgi:hypothetical protein